MNLLNLKKAQDHIQKIPKDQFSMENFREKIEDGAHHQCETVGCIIGWCTILDTPINVEKFRTVLLSDGRTKTINFTMWSKDFFNITPFAYENIDESYIWEWLFSGIWGRLETTNTVDHAVYRIQKVLDGFRPGCFHYLDELDKLNIKLK